MTNEAPEPSIEKPVMCNEMTLRDHFAANLAVLTFAEHHGNDWGTSGTQHQIISARKAYQWADALMAARIQDKG